MAGNPAPAAHQNPFWSYFIFVVKAKSWHPAFHTHESKRFPPYTRRGEEHNVTQRVHSFVERHTHTHTHRSNLDYALVPYHKHYIYFCTKRKQKKHEHNSAGKGLKLIPLLSPTLAVGCTSYWCQASVSLLDQARKAAQSRGAHSFSQKTVGCPPLHPPPINWELQQHNENKRHAHTNTTTRQLTHPHILSWAPSTTLREGGRQA